MSPDLFDNFAKIVKSFSKDSSALDVAEQYAAMTTSEQARKPSDFAYCESNTWKLMAALARSNNKSTLNRYATVKQWVSQVPIDLNLLDKIKEQKLVDDELEEELNIIVRKNRVLKAHIDERPSKKPRFDSEISENDALYEQRYSQLRAGALKLVSDDKTLGYIFNAYIKYNQLALEDEEDVYSKINRRERSTWRDYVQHTSKDNSLGKYGKALYNTLGGNIPDLCATEGQTWEDIIWIYLNGRVEDLLDDPLGEQPASILPDDNIAQLALSKDTILDNNDPRILFHQVQTAILSNTTEDLIQKLHKGYVENQWDDNLQMDSNVKEQFLRFVSTWILFNRQYLKRNEDGKSTDLLAAYAELNAQPDTFRPVVIASYAAKLSELDQVRVFSKFLEDFDGDNEECSIILKLGKEYGLNMSEILNRTNDNLLTRARSTAMPQEPAATFEIDEPAETTTTEYDLYFRALHWLLLDGKLALQAVQSANEIIRYFLSTKRIYLVKQLFDSIPENIYERIVLLGTEGRPGVEEFDLHRQVMLIFSEFKYWQELIDSKPIDNGKLKELQGIYRWRDQVEKQTIRLEGYMTAVLEGKWLGDDSTKSQNESQDTLNSLDALKQLYIPEILIRYHHILHSTASIMTKSEEKSKRLNRYLTLPNHKDLFKAVQKSKRMPDVLEEFSKSLLS